MSRRWIGVVVASTATYAALQLAGRIAGSTAAERRRVLPGDDLVAEPGLVTNHAATLDAPPERVWPWLTQVGWHRAGWYTPGWVDRLHFPANLPSAEHLDPGLLRDLRAGDTIPDGPPGTAHFVVVRVDPPTTLVLRSTTHLPPGWAERFGATADRVWTFRLDPRGDRQTRLLLRNRVSLRPVWLEIGSHAMVVPTDLVMATGMLRGLQRRVAGS